MGGYWGSPRHHDHHRGYRRSEAGVASILAVLLLLVIAPSIANADCGVDEPRACLLQTEGAPGARIEGWVRDVAMCRPRLDIRLYFFQGRFERPASRYASVRPRAELEQLPDPPLGYSLRVRFRIPSVPAGEYRLAYGCAGHGRATVLAGSLTVLPGSPDTATLGSPGPASSDGWWLPVLGAAGALGALGTLWRARKVGPPN